MRLALCAAAVAAGTLSFNAGAHPVLLEEPDKPRVPAQGDARAAEVAPSLERVARPVERDLPPVPLVSDEIRIEESERLSRERRIVLPSENDGLAPGQIAPAAQQESLRSQVLRDFGDPFAQPLAPTLVAAARPDAALEQSNPTQASIREAVDNALKQIREAILDDDDAVRFSLAGIDFSLAVGGGQNRSTVNGTEPMPAFLGALLDEVRFDSAVKPVAMPGQIVPQAGAGPGQAAGAGAPPLGSPEKVALVPLALSLLQELATEPMVLIPSLTLLVLWLTYELATALRERRRWRRMQRREARERA